MLSMGNVEINLTIDTCQNGDQNETAHMLGYFPGDVQFYSYIRKGEGQD